MITEDYVSFDTAKLLKEKGFDCECRGYYDTTKHLDYMLEHSGSEMNSNDGPDCYISAPTLQMAMKWLREEYKIFICIVLIEEIDMYGFTIEDISSKKYLATSKNYGYPTYEEACEAAIKYCLENLI